jgi:hypothetical protein
MTPVWKDQRGGVQYRDTEPVRNIHHCDRRREPLQVALCQERNDTLVFRQVSVLMNGLVRVRIDSQEGQQQQQHNADHAKRLDGSCSRPMVSPLLHVGHN